MAKYNTASRQSSDTPRWNFNNTGPADSPSVDSADTGHAAQADGDVVFRGRKGRRLVIQRHDNRSGIQGQLGGCQPQHRVYSSCRIAIVTDHLQVRIAVNGQHAVETAQPVVLLVGIGWIGDPVPIHDDFVQIPPRLQSPRHRPDVPGRGHLPGPLPHRPRPTVEATGYQHRSNLRSPRIIRKSNLSARLDRPLIPTFIPPIVAVAVSVAAAVAGICRIFAPVEHRLRRPLTGRPHD